MPFLGKSPTAGFASIVKDDLTPDGSTTAFTLSKQVANSNDIAVFVGNVRQEPTDAYSVSGTTLTMTAAPASGLNFYVLHIAGTLESSVVPADNTISTAKIQDDAITGAKIENNPTIAGTLTSTGLITASAGLTLSDGDVTVANGHGINFAANPDAPNAGATANSELLDDYEEGTWTPVLQSSSANANITFSPTNRCHYTKVGRQVHISFAFTVTVTSAGSGYFQIRGIPFTKMANHAPIGTLRYEGVNSPRDTIVLEFVTNSATDYMYLRGISTSSGGADVNTADLATGDYIAGNMTYFVTV